VLLAGNTFATAWHLSDESIEEAPAPVDGGGYLLNLWPAFHRTFATCGDYHMQVDNRGQRGYDATGLGRLHRRGVRPETALSTSIPAQPNVLLSIDAAGENAAIGPVLQHGLKRIPLAECSEKILSADVTRIAETPTRVAFAITYRGDLPNADSVTMAYELTPNGLSIIPTTTGGELCEFQVPLIVTDGEGVSRISLSETGFRAVYDGATYRVSVDDAKGLDISISDTELPNNTGIYRLGRFVGDVAGRRFSLIVESD
jgi:hypothetical protein